MKLYRTVCERRLRHRCACCDYSEADEANHSWEGHVEQEATAIERYAKEAETRLWTRDQDREDRYEYRNIHIEVAANIEWQEAA